MYLYYLKNEKIRNLAPNIWTLNKPRLEPDGVIGIAPKNGGQVLKQFLIDEEYDLSQFEGPAGNEFQIRRKNYGEL